MGLVCVRILIYVIEFFVYFGYLFETEFEFGYNYFFQIFQVFKYLFRSKSSLYKIQTLKNYRIICFALNSVQVLWLD